jgi:cold shock protein
LDLFPDYVEGVDKLLRVFGYAGREKPKLTYVEKYRRLGTLVRLNSGYGFIQTLPLAKDIFFHHSELLGVSFEELREGDSITFILSGGTHGLVATGVQRL